MINADMFVVEVSGGNVIIKDLWSTSNAIPTIDTS